MEKSPASFFLPSFFALSFLVALPAWAEEPASSPPVPEKSAAADTSSTTISSDGTKTTTIKKEDGSVIVRSEKPDGSMVDTVSNIPDGSTTETTTMTDGTIIIKKTTADQKVTITTISANGSTPTTTSTTSDLIAPPDPTPTPAAVVSSKITKNKDGSTTTTLSESDGTSITIFNTVEGKTIKTIYAPDGTMTSIIIQADGTTIKTINEPDGTTVKTTTLPTGKTVTTTTSIDGITTTTTGSAPTSGASPTPSPSSTPIPTTPLVAPYDIDMAPVFMGEKNDTSNLFLISASCITADQYAAFLNAVAKFSDAHELYYEAMGTPPVTKTDFHGNKTTPKIPQIIRTLLEDGSWSYSVAHRDESAHVLAAPNMTYKELPVTYVTLVDAARFCNWLHHDQPVIGKEGNPDDATEGGAYLIDAGYNSTFKRYEEIRSTITLLPTALWRIPSYFDYNGVHHDPRTDNVTIPDFTEPRGEFSGSAAPAGEVNGFFNFYRNIWNWGYAHYELTSTHFCMSQSAEHLYQCPPGAYGEYYVVKSPTEEKKQFAAPSVINPTTHSKATTKDNDSSFRVMPLFNYAPKVSPDPMPSAEGSVAGSPAVTQ